MENKFHTLGEVKTSRIPEHFIFFDTETRETIISPNEKILTLKLGWALYWNSKTKFKEYFAFNDAPKFWDFVISKCPQDDELYLYAHNTDFDMKISDGFNELFIKRKFELQLIYIEGKVFLMTAYKYGKKIHIGDTSNYIPKSLEYIGDSLNFPKTKINFKNCTYQELSDYCKNDVNICFKFIQTLIDFLITYNLGGFKNTAASLSFNCFRHSFYNKEEHPIFIHIFKEIIKSERNSYKGGITDLFKYGRFTNKLIKLDINSMYPFIMKNKELPYQFIGRDIKENLKDKLESYLKKYSIIMECKIYLPEKYAYLLTRYKKDKENKNGFIFGEFNTTICNPEIEFVLKYGKILSIEHIDLYNKGYVFSDFVDFFYKKRLQFDKENNKAFSLLCKLFLNSLYGKFGQKGNNSEFIEANNLEPKLQQLPKIIGDNKTIIQIGNKIVTYAKNEENSFDTLVAISSFITAYARMYLIEILLKIGRKNVYYMDTDSIIANEKAINKIKKYIDFKNKRTLGKLKIEGYSEESIFYRPKYYKFDNDLKCKGLNISIKALKEGRTKILTDNDKILKVKQEQFERFKTSFRKNSLNCVRVINIDKEMNKFYNKGKILPNHDIKPFNACELKVSPELFP